ncbi:MAG: acyclic terpene utilization AtuA family protein [Bacillaceae bacterium]|nr:acyclic terpene utilization AtuA family protein [Bacillaceae bacterium]
MKEIRILSPQGMLGYGYPMESLKNGLASHPHAIAVDAGSTDGGPHRLGLGVGGVSRMATKKDLKPLIIAARERRIPLIIGSAGGSGAGVRVDWTLDIVREIAGEENLSLRVALIYSDMDPEWVKAEFRRGNLSSIGSAPPLTEELINQTSVIVAQMGAEPYLEALKQEPDIIIGGRTYDPVMTAALALQNGMDPGPAYHMGKILECGALAARPATAGDGMIGILRDNHFLVRPLNGKRICTTQSVAAHTLYEKSHPALLPGPGGILDLTDCRFEQVDERTVRVTGSRFIPEKEKTVKLEGVRQAGYRSVLVAGVRDPGFIRQHRDLLKQVEDEAASYFEEVRTGQARLHFKTYGVDAVMGERETETSLPHEIGLVLEVVAETQELADSICAFTRSALMHKDYDGRVSTAGNLALPFAPPEFSAGPVFTFSIYHAVKVDDPLSLFPVKMVEIGRGE